MGNDVTATHVPGSYKQAISDVIPIAGDEQSISMAACPSGDRYTHLEKRLLWLSVHNAGGTRATNNGQTELYSLTNKSKKPC